MKHLTSVILFAMGAAAVPASSMANELDQQVPVSAEQKALAANLPATVVVRVNLQDQSVAVLHSDKALAADATTATQVAQANFSSMQADATVSGELDRDSSTDSWYFHFNHYYNNYYAPVYYYGGYNYYYTPYYYYNYGAYSYYYYRWYW